MAVDSGRAAGGWLTRFIAGVVLTLGVAVAGQGPVETGSRASSGNAIAEDYFGLHVFYPHMGTAWPAIRFGSLRIWDVPGTTWSDIEPVRGQWNFEALDKVVDLATRNGVSIVYTLGQTPPWASARPDEPASRGSGRGAEPKSVADWEAYVRAVATRYRGRIKAYEIWNEPRFRDLYPWRNAGFYSGSARAMVDLARVAYRTIKLVDPDAVVVSPAMDGEDQAIRKFELFAREGGGEWCDVIGWHFYSLTSTRPEDLAVHYRDVRRMLDRVGLSNKPVWNTETGVLVDHGKAVKPMDSRGILSRVMTPQEAANYLARSMVILAGEGAVRYYWFAWDSGSMGALSSLPPRAPSEVAFAYSGLRRWLVGASVEPCRDFPGGIFACSLRRAGRTAFVVWSASGTREFSIPDAWKATSREALFGGSARLEGQSIVLGERPILLKQENDDWK